MSTHMAVEPSLDLKLLTLSPEPLTPKQKRGVFVPDFVVFTALSNI